MTSDSPMNDPVFNAMLMSMCFVCTADGVIQESEIDAIVTIARGYTGIDVDEVDVRRVILQTQEQGSDIASSLRDTASRLDGAGKETVIKACLAVATADGSFDDTEKALVSQVASILGMTPAHMMGVIADIRQDAPQD